MENDQLKKAEKGLAGIFEKLPALPENGKKTLVEWFPWISVIFGALNVLAALSLWNVGRRVDRANEIISGFSRAYGGSGASVSLGTLYYVSLAVLLATGICMLLAFPGLKDRKKAGWNWLFLGEIVSLVAVVINLFVDYNVGSGGIFGGLLSAAIGFYLLYQVRSHYK